MTEMTTSETLNRAADGIQRDGFWQDRPGGVRAGESPTCASNAISRATRSDLGVRFAAQRALVSHLGGDPDSPNRLVTIFRWNDAPGRTAAEVIEALRACAVIEASREQASAEVSA